LAKLAGMSDPQTPVLDDAEQSPVATPIRYVSWVHFGDPGWRPSVPGEPIGKVAVAWALHFDGERVERKRGESVRAASDDPWWMCAQQYRERTGEWSATGGASNGTIVSFWVA